MFKLLPTYQPDTGSAERVRASSHQLTGLRRRYPLKGILLALFWSLAVVSQAQTLQYQFSQTSGTYTPITGGTLVAAATPGNTDELDDITYYGITLPFTFTYNGAAYTSVNISTNGYITLGTHSFGQPAIYTPISNSTVAQPAYIAVFGNDMQAVENSSVVGEIRMQTIGTAPNREVVIQWSHFQPWTSGYADNGYDLNYQVRLFEANNAISFVYGPSTAGTLTDAIQVGLRGGTNADFINRTTTTNSWSNTVAGTVNTATMPLSPTALPASGLTYKFTPVPCTGPPTAGTAVASSTAICPGGSTNLSLSGYSYGSGQTYQWQQSTDNVNFTNISGATGFTYTAPAISQSTYFRAIVTCSGQSATSGSVLVSISSPQLTGTNSPVSRCGYGPVTLTASGTGTINWYETATSTTPVATGTSFTPNVTTSRSYFVSASQGGGTFTAGRGSTTGADGSYTGSNTGLVFNANSAFTLQSVVVYPNGAAGNLVIELQNSSGTVLQTSPVYAIPAGSGASTPVTVPLNFSIAPGTGYRLVTGSPTVALLRDGNVTTFPYSSPDGSVSITGGYLGGASTNYYFFYNWIINTGCNTARTQVDVIVTTPPTLTVTPSSASICAGGSATLTASGSGYTSYTWSPATGLNTTTGATVTASPATTTTYTVTATGATCGAQTTVTVQVGATPPVPVITASGPTTICQGGSVTLSVPAATSTTTTVTIGSGTTANTAGGTGGGTGAPYPAPYGNYYRGARHQMLIKAEELTAAGLSAGSPLNSLAFDVASVNAAASHSGFTIKIGHTSLSNMTAFQTGLTQVYGPAAYMPVTGWNTHNFTSSFVWNGTSNIIVETCFSNNSFSENASTRYSVTNFVSTIVFRQDAGFDCASTGVAGSTQFTYSARPNIRFGLTTTYTWSPAAGLNTTTGATVVASPTSTTTYTVTASAGGTCTSSATQTVTVSPALAAPTVASQTICGSGPVTLTATSTSAGTFKWYNAPTGGTLLFTGPSYTTNVAASTVFYVDLTNNGCTSSRTAASVTVVAGGETYLLETIGTVSTTTTIAAHEAANGFVNDELTMSGTGDLRNTNPSTTYAGASGGANVFLQVGGKDFMISGINTVGLGPLDLSFGVNKSTNAENGSALKVEVSADGTNWTTLSKSLIPTGTGTATGTAWYFLTTTGTIPSTSNLRIRFTNLTPATSANTFRIDDVTLTFFKPVISTPNGTTVCSNATIALTSSSAGAGATYLWSNGMSGQTINVSTGGNYTVTVTLPNGCTTTSDPVTITGKPAPVATFTYSGPYCTTGSTASPTFTGGGVAGTFTATPSGLTLNAATGAITLSASAAGTYTVTNAVTGTNGCSSSASASVTIGTAAAVNVSANPTSVCQNATVTLTASSTNPNYTYSWSGPGLNSTTGASVTATPATTGTATYTVTATDNSSGACTSTGTVNVSVVAQPAQPSVTSAQICGPGSVTLTASSSTAGTFRWYSAATGGTLLHTGASYTTNVSGNTNFYVELYNGSCSSTRATASVMVVPAASVSVSATPTSVCQNGIVTLTASSSNANYTYTWSGPGLITTTGATVTASPSAVGTATYTVTANDAAASCTNSASANVTVTAKPVINAGQDQLIAQGSTTTLLASTTNSIGLKITEVAQTATATGGNTSWPSYMSVPNGSLDEFIEISNISNVGLQVGGYTIQTWTGTGSTADVIYTIPARTNIPPNGILVLHIGPGTNSAANRYYNTGGTANQYAATDAVGYVIKSGSAVVDVVATNGFVFPAASGVTTSDWAGAALNIGNPIRAGVMRNSNADTNTSANWVVASNASRLTIGTYNSGLANLNLGSISWLNTSTSQTQAGAAITTPIINNATTYIAYYTANGCTGSDTVEIEVCRPGIATPMDSIICSGSTTITLSGSNGSSFIWQMFNGSTWVSAPGNNTSLVYNTGILNKTTQYRARTTCSASVQTTTKVVTIYVRPVTALPLIPVTFTGFTGNNLSTVFQSWAEGVGRLNITGTSSAWTIGNSAQESYFGTRTARVNLAGNTLNEWIVGPAFPVSDSTKVYFKAAITEQDGNTPAFMGSDDGLYVMISTNCGVTWDSIFSLNAADSLPNVLTNFTVDLSAYAGMNVVIALQASEGDLNNPESYDLHVDDILILNPEISVPTAGACLAADPVLAQGRGEWRDLVLDGEVVAAINDNFNNLGVVELDFKYHNSNGGSNLTVNQNGEPILDRYFHFNGDVNEFTGSFVQLEFYVKRSEIQALASSQSLGFSSTDPDVAVNELTITQYQGDNENCTPLDNVQDSTATDVDVYQPSSINKRPYADGYILSISVYDHLSEFSIGGPPIPLPVVLTSYTAVRQGNDALLRWTTAMEENNQGFKVEVSTDGQTFKEIGFVESSQGNTVQTQRYSFTDRSAGKFGTRYYRLTQLDLDGKQHSAGVRAVRFDEPATLLSVMPNPFTDQFQVQLTAAAAEQATLTLTDVLGRVVETRTVSLSKGLNAFTYRPGRDTGAGMYLLQVQIGAELLQAKLLKQ